MDQAWVKARVIGGVAGALAGALGLAVMLGWHLNLPALVRVSPSFSPMAYNAALALFLAGIGLLAAGFRWSRVSLLIGGAVALVGALHLAEYVLGVDLGIDELLMPAYLPKETRFPGRMALHMAIGLTALGSALVVMARPVASRRPLLPGLLGAAVAALGLGTLTSYAIGLQTASTWSSYPFTGFNAALGLSVTGVGVIGLAWQQGKQEKTGTPHWFPVLVAAAGIVVSLVLWQALENQQHAHIDQTVQAEADNLRQDLAARIEQQARGIEDLGRQWESQGHPRQADWEWDAALPFDYAFVKLAAWVDPSLHVRWVVPGRGNAAYQGLDLGANEGLRSTLARAQALRRPHTSSLFRLPTGERGFLIARAVFPGDRADGFIACFFLLNPLCSSAFRPGSQTRYALTVLEDGQETYDYRMRGVAYDDAWSAESAAELCGARWTVRVSPPRDVIQALATKLPGVFLVLSLLPAFLLALAVHLAQTSQSRGTQLAAANLELKAEVVERQRAQEELRKQAELLDLTHDSIILRDLHGRITFWNRGAEEQYGWKQEEVLGQVTHTLLQTKFPVSLEELQQKLRDEGRWEGELTHRTRGGGEIVVASRQVVQRDRDGTPRAILQINNDITERRRAEEELKRHVEELARSNAELEQFAYVASHDLQEPLRMVASYTQLLSRRYRDRLDSTAEEFMDYAVDGARRMQNLINDLLTYSRVGTRGKEFAPTDCGKVLETAIANLQTAIEENGAAVAQDPLPVVMADDSQMLQLFQNLVANAVKFHGAEPPRVHVSARRQAKDWLFAVRDNGIGIDSAHQQRIFTIFQRLHGKAEYPGTGIGLAICKKIVERHGGRIWVESQAGQGATFLFTIPA
jgi:PAS domain S-box-containing protein